MRPDTARSRSPSVEEVIGLVRFVACRHGYAIGVHGSLDRDVDLIAAPWIEHTSTPDELAKAIADALGSSVMKRRERWHGRIGYVVVLRSASRPNYVDLSVLAPFGAAGRRSG